MTKTKLPHFPLFFGDLLAATPRPKWKGPHRSLYVLLLAHQWFYGALPTEPESIADMCDYPLDEFTRLWQVVGKKFVECDGGLMNLRCEEHREKASRISKKRATAGKKGGETTRQRIKQTGQQTGQQTGKQTEQQTGQQVATPFATPFAGPSIPSHPIPSDPTPTHPEARFAREIARAQPPEPDESGISETERRERWDRCRRIYPPYNGRTHWIMAESAASSLVRLKRGTWDDIEAATKRYNEFCRVTQRQVMRPEHFFSTDNDPPCLQAWDLPDAQPSASSAPTRGDSVIEEFFKERAATTRVEEN